MREKWSGLARVLFANMEVADCHQLVTEMFWLQFLGVVLCFSLIPVVLAPYDVTG